MPNTLHSRSPCARKIPAFVTPLSVSTFKLTRLRKTTPLPQHPLRQRQHRRSFTPHASHTPHTTALIIPTGIGAQIGGFAGDALPTARLISSVTDTLVTHPNVLNGALMYYPLKNTYYLEGHTLDQFAAQHISLSPLTHGSNRIGLLLDAAIPPDLTQRHIQAAEAARATLGLRMGPYAVTSRPVGVELAVSAGASWGGVRDAGTLLEAGKRLVDAGCDAIAVVTAFPEEDDTALSEYRTNGGVDVIAGAEAVISHLLTRELCIPVAHAPALEPIPVEAGVNPKAAAEELGYTFLSCVLVGLSRAPKIVSPGQGVCGRDVDVVIVPEGACGGAAVMSFAAHGALIVVVSENGCVLKIGPEDVGIPEQQVVRVRNYAEAAGVVAAHRAGIELCALSAHVPHLQSVPSRTFAVPAHSKVRQNGSLASV